MLVPYSIKVISGLNKKASIRTLLYSLDVPTYGEELVALDACNKAVKTILQETNKKNTKI